MPTSITDVAPELVVDFDVHDPTLSDHVHDRLAEIQAQHRVAYSTAHGGYWLVTRHEDVHEMMRRWEVFSSTENAVPSVDMAKFLPLQYDPPEHTAYRTLLNPLFGSARMQALEPVMREQAARLLDAFAGRSDVEFVSAFAHAFPSAMFLSLVGWPLDDLGKFEHWNEVILFGKPDAPPEEDMQYRAESTLEVFGYFAEMIAARKANPDVDDITGALLKAQYNGERPLTEDEILRALWLLMIGGLHTVSSGLAFGMIHLAANPEQRQIILDDPAKIPSAVEEILRIDAPVAPGRIVTRDVEFAGVQMLEGDRVVGFLSAANRDEAHFECPHAFQVERTPNRHLTFGGGPHRCLGSNLARAEMAIAMEEIHRRMTDYRLDPTRPPVRHHSQVRGVNELWLQFTPFDAPAS
jgi:cytochrome P450